MAARTKYSLWIPFVILTLNVLVLGPMGWIVSGTLKRIEHLETTQSDIEIEYVTNKEFMDDLDAIRNRLNVLEGRLYDIR